MRVSILWILRVHLAAPHRTFFLIDGGLLRLHVFLIPFLWKLKEKRRQRAAFWARANDSFDILAFGVENMRPAAFFDGAADATRNVVKPAPDEAGARRIGQFLFAGAERLSGAARQRPGIAGGTIGVMIGIRRGDDRRVVRLGRLHLREPSGASLATASVNPRFRVLNVAHCLAFPIIIFAIVFARVRRLGALELRHELIAGFFGLWRQVFIAPAVPFAARRSRSGRRSDAGRRDRKSTRLNSSHV